MRQTFTRIYEQREWAVSPHDPISGCGSTLTATKPYRELLEALIAERGIKTVLDLGCGDWTFSRHVDWGNVDYLGVDVVEPLIRKLSARFAKRNIAFVCADIRDFTVRADLIIVKDVLQHWPLWECLRMLTLYFEESSAILVTNTVEDSRHRVLKENTDCEPGGFRPIDMLKEPFKSPAVEELLRWKVWLEHGYNVKQTVLLRKSD